MVENDDALIEKLFDHGYKARPERVILFTIDAWDANCSQHITARLSEPEIERLFATVQERDGRPSGGKCEPAGGFGRAGESNFLTLSADPIGPLNLFPPRRV